MISNRLTLTFIVVGLLLGNGANQQAIPQDEKQGRRLFEKLKCIECHSIAGTGGCLGPELDGVMKRHDQAYVRMRLNKDDEDSFIRLIGHPELMPHPRFKKKDVADLVAFLSSLPARNAGGKPHHNIGAGNSATDNKEAAHKTSAESIAIGKKLFYNSGCLSCHRVAGLGGRIGPDLDDIAKRRNWRSIQQFISNPADKRMPVLQLSDLDRKNIAEFLMSLSD